MTEYGFSSEYLHLLVHEEQDDERQAGLWLVTKEKWKDIEPHMNLPITLSKALKKCDGEVKVEIYENYIVGTLERITYRRQQYESDQLDFIFYPEKLIIIVSKYEDWLSEWITEMKEDEIEKETLGYLFYRFLDCMVKEDKTYLEKMEEKIERLEEEILNDKSQNFIQNLIGIRKQIAQFKKHYDPVSDIIEDLIHCEAQMCQKEDIRYFRIFKKRIERFNHAIDAIDEYATHVREAYDAQIDIKQNVIMKYFTLMTTLFFPLTLIVGWYGMNFESMPELKWKYGYIYVIIISVVSSVLFVYCFKKKKWL